MLDIERLKDLYEYSSSHTEVIYLLFCLIFVTGKLLDFCKDCKLVRMAAVPQGAFAARKVREAFTWQQQLNVKEETKYYQDLYHEQVATQAAAEAAMEQPMQYSSKLMNSIWGLYNRYSVHNFKKNTDAALMGVGEHQLNAAVSHSRIGGMFQKN